MCLILKLTLHTHTGITTTTGWFLFWQFLTVFDSNSDYVMGIIRARRHAGVASGAWNNRGRHASTITGASALGWAESANVNQELENYVSDAKSWNSCARRTQHNMK